MARLLADSGVNVVAGIPGRTTYALADALVDEPRITRLTLRHEAVGTFAADAYYRVSGRPMAVMTHTLAGTSNALAGVANAYAESSSMLLIVGEEAREGLGRGTYQEFSRSMDGDLPQVLRHMTKRSWVTHSAPQLVEQFMRARRTATTERPGPVSLHVFADVWDRTVELPGWPDVHAQVVADDAVRPGVASVAAAVEALSRAKRPLLFVGNGVNIAHAHAELLEFVRVHRVPVVTTVTGKGAIPEDNDAALGVVGWVGTAPANWASQNADLILGIGCRFTETSTSSWQPTGAIDPRTTTIVHSDIDPLQVGNVFPSVALVGDAKAVLKDLSDALGGWTAPHAWLESAQERRLEWIELSEERSRASGAELPVGPVISMLRSFTNGLPLNIVGDVGKHQKWLAQQFQARSGDIIISSMGAGTMGIGPCGALGAALGRPEAKTIAWCGDGGMSMSLPVLPTVAEYGLPILYLVIDDGCYGAVANSQIDRFGRSSYSEFDRHGLNPDYRLDIAAVSEACGVPARRITDVDELERGLKWGLESSGPALLDIIVDRGSAAPNGGGFKLNDIWNHPTIPWASQA